MNVNATGAMTQMQTQMQMQKMDGTGQGQGAHKGQGGANGMKDIMQSLSPEDRATFSEQLQSMSQEEKSAIKDELKSIDATSMDSGSYLEALMNVVSGTSSESTESFVTEVYA